MNRPNSSKNEPKYQREPKCPLCGGSIEVPVPRFYLFQAGYDHYVQDDDGTFFHTICLEIRDNQR